MVEQRVFGLRHAIRVFFRLASGVAQAFPETEGVYHRFHGTAAHAGGHFPGKERSV